MGLYVVYMCELGVSEEGGDRESTDSEALSLLSCTLRYLSLEDLERLCQVGL